MNDGGYSRLEKDFLGNERMVHYDASGNMLGASDVIREPDGTIRVSGEQISAESAGDFPEVEAVVPTPKAPVAASAAPTGVRDRSEVPRNQVAMYAIAAFVATSIVTLGVLQIMKSNRGETQSYSLPQSTYHQVPQPNNDVQPGQENFPNDPKPRNDDPPAENRPFDQSSPDSNMDDNRPRVRNDGPSAPPGNESNPQPKPKKAGPDDPIDLRGDDGGKKGDTNKGDPAADPLKGNDIH